MLQQPRRIIIRKQKGKRRNWEKITNTNLYTKQNRLWDRGLPRKKGKGPFNGAHLRYSFFFFSWGEKNFRENGSRLEDFGCDRDWNLTFMRSGSANRDDRNVNTVRGAGRTDPKRTLVWGTRLNHSCDDKRTWDRTCPTDIAFRRFVFLDWFWLITCEHLVQNLYLFREIFIYFRFSRTNDYRGVSYFHRKRTREILSKHLWSNHSFEFLLSIFVLICCTDAKYALS